MERSTIFNGKIYGKSPFLIGKSTISMAIFHSYARHNQMIVPSLRVLDHWSIAGEPAKKSPMETSAISS